MTKAHLTKKDLNQTVYVKQEVLEKKRWWYTVDADGKNLGRLAVEIAKKLQGKDKAHYCDFWDTGAFVVVQNAEKITVTGYKLNQKNYFTYSGWKGNVKSRTLQEMLDKDPTKVLWLAVRGMLPKNKLRAKRMKRLKLFVGESTKYDNLNPIQLLND